MALRTRGDPNPGRNEPRGRCITRRIRRRRRVGMDKWRTKVRLSLEGAIPGEQFVLEFRG